MIFVTENNNINLKLLKQNLYISSWNPKEVTDFHKSIGNKETPLVELPGIALSLIHI